MRRLVCIVEGHGEMDAAPVLCDADDDCPATWGRRVPSAYSVGGRSITVGGVMACREFESWLLWGFADAERALVKAPDPELAPRDAKKALARLVPGYTPTTHQLAQARSLSLATAWAASDSFDKLVRSVAAVVCVEPPPRPTR